MFGIEYWTWLYNEQDFSLFFFHTIDECCFIFTTKHAINLNVVNFCHKQDPAIFDLLHVMQGSHQKTTGREKKNSWAVLQAPCPESRFETERKGVLAEIKERYSNWWTYFVSNSTSEFWLYMLIHGVFWYLYLVLNLSTYQC